MTEMHKKSYVLQEEAEFTSLYSLFLEYYPEESTVLIKPAGARLDWLTYDQHGTETKEKVPCVL